MTLKTTELKTVDIQTTTTTSLSQAGAFLLDNAGFELEALCSLFDEVADLRAKLNEARNDALEEAARICDTPYQGGALAQKIRALKEQEKP